MAVRQVKPGYYVVERDQEYQVVRKKMATVLRDKLPKAVLSRSISKEIVHRWEAGVRKSHQKNTGGLGSARSRKKVLRGKRIHFVHR